MASEGTPVPAELPLPAIATKHVSEAVVGPPDQDTCHLYHCHVEKSYLAEPCPIPDPQISDNQTYYLVNLPLECKL